MKFNRGARLDTSQVSDRRGMSRGGKAAAGGGIGALLVALFAYFGGAAPTGLFGGDDDATGSPGDDVQSVAHSCETVADIEDNPDCRFVAYVNSIQAYWNAEFARRGAEYRPADTNFFTESVSSACGLTSANVGPFYCPGDQEVFLELGFFDELQRRFGASGGPFGEAYVVAHEYGHHIQNITGVMRRANMRGSGPTSDPVRLELQADCYAGLWAHYATRTPHEGGDPLITELTEQDIRDGLDAARVVGDDYIQARATGMVRPESWTHGSSAQRQRWFLTGFQSGNLAQCDTFAARL